MAGIDMAVETAGRYIIKRPRLTRLLDGANARALMLIGPAGFGKTTLAREWVADRAHAWYRGTTATADVAALAAGLADVVSELIPEAGSRMVHRMRATGTPEQDVDILADLFAEDLAAWPADTWLVIDDYQFAMEARAPERFVDVLLRRSPLQLLLTSRKRPSWASARRLLYGEVYELGRNELAMDHDEASAVLAHRKGAPAAGLVALAEGWPAVIGLAALTDDFDLPEGTLPDALYDYFAEELYQAASPEVQQGLCRLALAPSLGDGVAEFLLGGDAPQVIGEAARLGFLTLRPGTLELHPLLRTFLDTKGREERAWNLIEAGQLARHIAHQERWDDAFDLVDEFFSEDLFLDLLAGGLQGMLTDARVVTVRRWLDLAEAKLVDSPIVDLAGAEIAFHEGKSRKSEALALRATRRLKDEDGFKSRAFYIAGMSAHLDYYNERAKLHCDRALATAKSLTDQRDAVWGRLIASLDLEGADVGDLLGELIELDDGTALSEVRVVVAQYQVAIRQGDLRGLKDMFDAAAHVVDRVTDPHVRSSFYYTHSNLLALLGLYSEALAAVSRCEAYAKEARLSFVVPYARRVKAVSQLGLRHFARCTRTLESLDRAADARDEVFLKLEAKLLKCRLLVVQGLPSQGADVLKKPPDRFPFEGERGEYLATLGLARACAGDFGPALELASEAESVSQTIEVRALGPCIRAIVAVKRDSSDAHQQASDAFESIRETQVIDPFVVAYRGCPEFLATLSESDETHSLLTPVVLNAQDRALVRGTRLVQSLSTQSGHSTLSPREEEVLGLVAQGLTNKEIARTLFISESTTKVHVRHILEKLGARSRTEAALRSPEEMSEGS